MVKQRLKRMLSLAVVTVMVMSMIPVGFVTASAVEADTFTACGQQTIEWDKDAAKHITFDGDLSDWQSAGYELHEITMDNMVPYDHVANNTMPANFKMSTYYVADADYLYMGFYVVDDEVHTPVNDEIYSYQSGESISIAIDLNAECEKLLNQDPGYFDMIGADAENIMYSFAYPGDGKDITFAVQNVWNADSVEARSALLGYGVKGKASKTEEGWCAEIALSWEMMWEDFYYKSFVPSDYEIVVDEDHPLTIGSSICYLNANGASPIGAYGTFKSYDCKTNVFNGGHGIDPTDNGVYLTMDCEADMFFNCSGIRAVVPEVEGTIVIDGKKYTYTSVSALQPHYVGTLPDNDPDWNTIEDYLSGVAICDGDITANGGTVMVHQNVSGDLTRDWLLTNDVIDYGGEWSTLEFDLWTGGNPIAFGYQIGEAEPVFDDAFITEDKALIPHGGTHRGHIVIPVGELAEGNYNFLLVAKIVDVYGNEVMVNLLPVFPVINFRKADGMVRDGYATETGRVVRVAEDGSLTIDGKPAPSTAKIIDGQLYEGLTKMEGYFTVTFLDENGDVYQAIPVPKGTKELATSLTGTKNKGTETSVRGSVDSFAVTYVGDTDSTILCVNQAGDTIVQWFKTVEITEEDRSISSIHFAGWVDIEDMGVDSASPVVSYGLLVNGAYITNPAWMEYSEVLTAAIGGGEGYFTMIDCDVSAWPWDVYYISLAYQLEDGSIFINKSCHNMVYYRGIEEPSVPAKPGYIGTWEPYTLNDTDITVRPVYTLCTEHVWDDGVVTTPATHLTEGVKTGTCTLCGATTTQTVEKLPDHTYDTLVPYDGNLHKTVCACGKAKYVSHVFSMDGSYNADGHKASCACGEYYYLSHSMSSWRSYDAESHYRYCYSCNYKEYADHDHRYLYTYTDEQHRAQCTCGYSVYVEHNVQTWTSYDELLHFGQCACGETVYVEHDWDIVQTLPAVVTYTCKGCGKTHVDVSTELPLATVKGASVVLGQALGITYNAEVQNATSTPVMKFTVGGKVMAEVAGEYNATNGRYYFTLTGINPQCIGDNILAEVYVDGVLAGYKDEYSIKAYLVGQLSKSATAQPLKTLIYNTLAYGAAAQTYTGYNTGDMINAGYEDKAVAYSMGDTAGADHGFFLSNTRDDAKISGVSVNFGDVNKIMVQYVGTGVTLYVDGVAVDPASYDAASGKYTYYTDGIYASALGTVFTFQLKTADGAVISTLNFSVNAYAARQQGKATDNAKLAMALFNYGMAARIYLLGPEYEVTYDFSTMEEGEQYVYDERVLDFTVTMKLTDCHLFKQLRIYNTISEQYGNHDGNAVFESKKVITGFSMNVGHRDNNMLVYASVDGVNYVLVSTVAVTAEYSDHTVTLDASAGYRYIKLDAESAQLRIATLTLYFAD